MIPLENSITSSPIRAEYPFPYSVNSLASQTLISHEVFGRGRRLREGGRRAELGLTFGVLFPESPTEEVGDRDGRVATLLSFDETASESGSPVFEDSVPSIFVGAASLFDSAAFNGDGLMDLLTRLLLR